MNPIEIENQRIQAEKIENLKGWEQQKKQHIANYLGPLAPGKVSEEKVREVLDECDRHIHRLKLDIIEYGTRLTSAPPTPRSTVTQEGTQAVPPKPLTEATRMLKRAGSSKYLTERRAFESIYNKAKEKDPNCSFASIIREAKKRYPNTIEPIPNSTIRKWIKK